MLNKTKVHNRLLLRFTKYLNYYLGNIEISDKMNYFIIVNKIIPHKRFWNYLSYHVSCRISFHNSHKVLKWNMSPYRKQT